MALQINREEVCMILDWRERNNASFSATAKHFDKNVKTISTWAKRFDLDELRNEFRVVHEVGETVTTIEKKLPPGVKEKSEEILQNVSESTLLISKSIKEYVQNLATKDGKHLKPYEIQQLASLLKLYLPLVVTEETETRKRTDVLKNLISAQIREANKINKRISNQ